MSARHLGGPARDQRDDRPGAGAPRETLGLLAAGLLVCGAWVAVEARSSEPLIDMTMMRIRGVWTTNLTAFLLGAGLYASFIIFPQFAQLPKSTGFGFGASVVVSGLYLLPSTIGDGRRRRSRPAAIAGRFGSKRRRCSPAPPSPPPPSACSPSPTTTPTTC